MTRNLKSNLLHIDGMHIAYITQYFMILIHVNSNICLTSSWLFCTLKFDLWAIIELKAT